ncbi:hypothetical protein K402DRAFT_454654 [Aulographum hederae CBS 113979]|uniref:Uncharacterized protein n=1 Tax=Aulographum hederae CBS 113979 TaxID=1176131 RepID=A0A6G1GZ15_9PEZI|nr:hypothetical protein K402DRAFT_454654 [Aulographum hederae CBS 113979]
MAQREEEARLAKEQQDRLLKEQQERVKREEESQPILSESDEESEDDGTATQRWKMKAQDELKRRKLKRKRASPSRSPSPDDEFTKWIAAPSRLRRLSIREGTADPIARVVMGTEKKAFGHPTGGGLGLVQIDHFTRLQILFISDGFFWEGGSTFQNSFIGDEMMDNKGGISSVDYPKSKYLIYEKFPAGYRFGQGQLFKSDYLWE